MMVRHVRMLPEGSCYAVQKMMEGPSKPAYRSRLQTTSSCIGKEPL
ncbi:MAG: hypothetical protein PHN86_09620 [Proteiniphilum sp.]|nr:hypothetical protein [Proteiniphilum sp.]